MSPVDSPPKTSAPHPGAPAVEAAARRGRPPATPRSLGVPAVTCLLVAAAAVWLGLALGAGVAATVLLLLAAASVAAVALTRGSEQRTRTLALRSGGPAATARLLDDGSVQLTWLSDAMDELLDPAAEGRPSALAEVLPLDSAARLSAVVRDLLRMDGRSASVPVTIQRGWPRQAWLHLQVQPPGRGERWVTALGGRPTRRAAVHAEPAAWSGGEAVDGRAELAERLRQALHRRRRWSSRIALAVVTALREEVEGPRAVPEAATAELAERVRQAARGTDAVVVLGPGRLAVLAEDVAEDGERVLARRVSAVLDRSAGEGRPLVVDVAVMEVVDVDADPDAVIGALLRSHATAGRTGGLTVLDPWTSTGPGAAEDHGAPAALDRRLRAAFASGRFVPGIRPMTAGIHGSGAARRLTVIEACTVEEGVVDPVAVDAPSLAAALDRWLVQQVAAAGPLPEDGVDRLLLLQPGGELAPWLADGLPEPAAGPGRLVLAVPERRLLSALTAERAVLRELALREVPLAVAGWSGLIDVPTLVRGGIGLVLLSAETQRAVVRPDGAALLAGLAAGLRAGLGDTATVFSVDAEEGSVTSALQTCGIACAVSAPVTLMRTP
ncbi:MULTISPECIES: hypothetical protein [unclassified Blastococcus]